MKLSHTSQALLDDLVSMARTVDPALGEQVARLSPMGAGMVSLRLLELVTELSADLSRTLPAGRVEVRLSSPESPELVYIDAESPIAAPAGDDGGQARLTVRLPQALKEQVEQAADAAGQSLNAWVVSRLTEAMGRRGRSSGRRLTGFGKA